MLRRTRLDEFCQLLNVLRGEMTLIGPRPERPYFVVRFSQDLPAYNQRHGMRPGLTGWAQANGLRAEAPQLSAMRGDLNWYYGRRAESYEEIASSIISALLGSQAARDRVGLIANTLKLIA